VFILRRVLRILQLHFSAMGQWITASTCSKLSSSLPSHQLTFSNPSFFSIGAPFHDRDFVTATNNMEKARSSARDKGKSKRMDNRNLRWENIKLDVLRIYIQEDRTLEDTMAAIQESHGFEAGYVADFGTHPKANRKSSKRSWKNKLDAWGYKKNMTSHDVKCIVAKGTKRILEGTDTVFFYRGTRVTKKRIENFKRRRIGEVSPSVREFTYVQHRSVRF
jgi:hypothetical protein